MRTNRTAPLFAITVALSGCHETAKTDTRTVGWFLDHRNELTVMLKTCRDNPGDLGKTPNCVNANEARNKITIQEMKDAL